LIWNRGKPFLKKGFLCSQKSLSGKAGDPRTPILKTLNYGSYSRKDRFVSFEVLAIAHVFCGVKTNLTFDCVPLKIDITVSIGLYLQDRKNMDRFIIWGGEPLRGEVDISGSKNSVLPVLAASLLADSPSRILNAPWLKDVDTMVMILQEMGVTIKRSFSGEIDIDPSTLDMLEAPWDLVRKMRSSIYVLGSLLGRVGEAKVSLPGGCVIGPRPIDLHIKGFMALGARITKKHGYLIAQAPKLVGSRMFLGGQYGSSMGATINVMLAAVKASGTTIIENAAQEPEVVDTVDFLNRMGAKITGGGTSAITVEGVEELQGVEYEVIPDRIEAGTFMIASVLTGGEVTVKKVNTQHLESTVDRLRQSGAEVEAGPENIRIRAGKEIKPVDMTTQPFPGFPTDLQAQFLALMSRAAGTSRITEKIYPDRFMHVGEFTRLGADIMMEGPTAVVNGVKSLSGAQVMASDLRASAALLLVGLAAEGETTVHRIYHIDRGYEDIEHKLAGLGAKIKRVKAN
jgi:UDP-N-acetylglucosamine 1-carboxyvinyltransferase